MTQVATNLKCTNYIESIFASSAWKVGSLCFLPENQSRLNTVCIFTHLPFLHALNAATISAQILLMHILKFLTKSNSISTITNTDQASRFRHFLTDVTLLASVSTYTNLNVLIDWHLDPTLLLLKQPDSAANSTVTISFPLFSPVEFTSFCLLSG